MDRAELSATIIQQLGAVFMAAVQQVAAEVLSADLDGIERRLQVVSRQVFGRVLEQVVAVRAGHPRERPPGPACGGLLRLVDRARPRQVHGLVGDATMQRPTYVCSRCGQGHAPLDTELGLGQGALTPALARVACRAGIETSFGEASDLLAETLGVAVPADAVRRVTERVGAVAETEQQAASAQAQQGRVQPDGAGAAVLVVEVDGVQVHLDDAWHEMKVGRVAPLGPALQTDPRSGRTFLRLGPSVCCAGLEAAEEFWYRVYVQACRGGLGQTTRRVVVLGDGAEWIWKRAAQFVGRPGVEVLEIVDINHAYDHLWPVGRAVFDAEADLGAWVEPLKDALYTQGAGAVLAALDALALEPAAATAADLLRTTRAYFADNAARMDYPRFVAQRLPIGSGAIESMCKSLIEEREKGAGMRWTGPGAQAVASLRALHRSGDWTAFWPRHPLRPRAPRARAARPGAAAPPEVVPAGPATDPGPPARSDAPPAEPAPVVALPPPVDTAQRPAPSHPWRRFKIGRARCA
jgi:hypothetical protein